MADEERFNDAQGRQTSRSTTSSGDVASAQDADRLGSTAGAGLGAKQKVGGKAMPKQSDFGGDMAAYGAAMRSWRQEQDAAPDNVAQKRALTGMQK